MKNSLDIHGVICPLITPFDQHFRVDSTSVRQHIDFLLAHGIHGLMIGGTTGEGLLLNMEERKAICKVVVEHVEDRVPVIAHTGCISTADTVELTKHAAMSGATAAAIIVPYFFGLDDESLFNHYVTVAEAAPNYPLFIYTFPGNAKNDISPDLLKRLRKRIPSIKGIKSTNPDLIRFQEYVTAGEDDFCTLNGIDGLMLPALTLGAAGQVSGTANVFPEIFCNLYESFLARDFERARSQQRLVNQIRVLLRDGFHPAALKAALAVRGISSGLVRSPMRELSGLEIEAIEKGMRELNITLHREASSAETR